MRGRFAKSVLLLLGSGLVTAAPAHADTKASAVASCGASAGMAYWAGVAHPQWSPDTIRGGSYTFSADDQGKIHIYFKDATGQTVDAEEDGALVQVLSVRSELGAFSVLVSYADAGVAETYSVVRLPDGKRKLLWTQSRMGWGQPAKIASFVADCD